MEDFNRQILSDLNLQTSLLEALDWDDDELKKLNDFLEAEFQINQPPALLLNNVKTFFNGEVHSILKDLFKKIYIVNGYHFKRDGGNIEN